MSNIIFVSPVKWEALTQRHQCFARELSKIGHKIFYLNPLLSGGFSFCAQNNENISLISIKVPFKASSYPKLQKYAVNIALKLLLKKIHLIKEETILWLAEPSCAQMALNCWKKVIYDCCDLHGNFPGQKIETWKYYEGILAEKSSLILASSLYIKEHFKEKHQHKCLLVPNATSYKSETRPNKQLQDNKIRLISSGAHFEWTDLDWLKIFAELEDVELNIAGTGRGKVFKQLISMKSVVYHKKLGQKDLLKLMKSCHVGLVPFKNLELIKGVDPIKVYDYAALSLEIWAPNIEPLKQNKYISSFISNKEEAEKACKNLRQKNSKVSFNPVPIWSERIKQIDL